MSTKSKGNYYKLKTKKYYEDKGYNVQNMEVPQRAFNPKTKQVFYVRRDILGADLLAYNKEQLILIQVKLNHKHDAEAIREFMKYDLPDFVERIVVVWVPRAKEPDIIYISDIRLDK